MNNSTTSNFNKADRVDKTRVVLIATKITFLVGLFFSLVPLPVACMNLAQEAPEAQKTNEQEYSQEATRTLLSLANTPKYAEELIRAKADVNAKDEWGNTALLNLISRCAGPTTCRHFKVASLLLEVKARADIPDLNGDSPLHLASRRGLPTYISLILQNEVNAIINMQNRSGRTPLHEATYSTTTQRLLDFKAQIDVQSNDGATPLLLACQKGQAAKVKTLLDANANPNITDNQWQTPLFIAYSSKDQDLLEELLRAHLRKYNAKLTRAITYMLRNFLPPELGAIVGSYAHNYCLPAQASGRFTWDMG